MEKLDFKRKLSLLRIYLKNIERLKNCRIDGKNEEIAFFYDKIEKLRTPPKGGLVAFSPSLRGTKGGASLKFNKNKLEEIYVNGRKKSIFDLPYYDKQSLDDDEIDREVLIGFEREKFSDFIP